MTFILQCKRAILMGESVHGSYLSKHRLARYGSWCIHQMRNRDSLHSGNKIIFCVQLQARYNDYKSTSPSQILKSESGKGNVVTVLENECQPVWYCNRQDHVDKL